VASDDQALVLIRFIESLPDFKVYKQTDFVMYNNVGEGFYNHMGATIADAILQAGLRYEAVVAPRVKRLLEKYPEATTTSAFLQALKTDGPETVLGLSGGKKPEYVMTVTRYFEEQGIQTENDLYQWLQDESNQFKLKQLKGIKDKTVDYIGNLVGRQNIAIDRHAHNLLREAGIEVNSYSEAQQIINEAADRLNIPRAVFDYSIWKFMSSRKKS
jgi:thermostable 8-oxoguanine DNA glycosylase